MDKVQKTILQIITHHRQNPLDFIYHYFVTDDRLTDDESERHCPFLRYAGFEYYSFVLPKCLSWRHSSFLHRRRCQLLSIWTKRAMQFSVKFEQNRKPISLTPCNKNI
jgi:hypothetical protein